MENRNKRPGGVDISTFIHNYITVLRRMFWLPLILLLLLGGYKLYKQYKTYLPYYEARATLTVSADYSSLNDAAIYSYYYDSNAASILASTFSYVLSTDTTKQLIYDELGTYSLGASVTGSCVADSNLFVMVSTSTDPQQAFDALQTIIRIYPQAVVNILGRVTLRTLEPPVVPEDPINPLSPVRPTVQYALVGLVIGLLLLALLALLRKTVHSAEDLHKLTNVPCLGYLPTVPVKPRNDKLKQSISITNPRMIPAYLEAVRGLRFKFLKQIKDDPAQVVMVTSTIPGEGKTTVAANLSLSLAEQGYKVILVDCDLRKQSLKTALGMDAPSEGIPELIANKATQIQPLAVPNSTLLLLCGNKIADQPQAFLSSARMKSIIQTLREEMDFVIIDTPPAGFLSDAATLAELVDAVLYVVRQDYANQGSIMSSIHSLATNDVRFLGCVLNSTERSTTKYGYGRYGYSSRYGAYYTNYGYTYGDEQAEQQRETGSPPENSDKPESSSGK